MHACMHACMDEMGRDDAHRPMVAAASQPPPMPLMQHHHPPSSLPELLRLRAEGRCRVGVFAHLMRYGTAAAATSSSGTSHAAQNWKLSANKRIQSPAVVAAASVHNSSRGGSSRPWTTALDLSGAEDGARFLLSGLSNGTVSVYDFGEQECSSLPKNDAQQQQQQQQLLYRPLQQATTRGSSSVTSVQWYTDTGAFLTASASGSVLLWDTEAMAPVLESRPFQFGNSDPETTNSCHCMKMSPFSLLAATGSHHSPLVKLVDLQSGASSHSLTPPHNHKNCGVTAVQWSPHNPHMLASCAGTVALWDIRRPKLPLTVLDEDHRPADASVSTKFQWDFSHLGNDIKRSNKKCHQSSSESHTTATNLAFASHHLVTLCARRRNLRVWDLRHSPEPVLLHRRYVDESNGKPLDQTFGGAAEQPLAVTGHGMRDRTAWIAKGHNLVGYSLFANVSSSGRPDAVLRGHLGRIRAVAANQPEQRLLDPPKMVTAGRDGLMLVWERQKAETETTITTTTPSSAAAAGTSRKRRIDQDSW